jgi:ribosomal protein S27E
MTQPVLDGNALAGDLAEIFRVDITAATGQCAHCRHSGPVAETRVYASPAGMVARCPACGEVVLRLVRDGGRAWLDLRGLTCLQVAIPAGLPGD